MALITTAWIMGSEPDVPETQIDVTANAVQETLTIPAGDYYMYDSSAANSAIDALETALESHSEIGFGGCIAYLRRDRLPRFQCGMNFTIDSWCDLTLRSILGFTGTVAFAASLQFPSGLSSYLWSPGRCEIPDAPLGSQGLPYKDTAKGQSGDRVVTATTNNTGRKNRFLFRRVMNTRVMTDDGQPGQHVQFWDLVQSRYYRWKLYRDVTEEDTAADDTQVSFSGGTLGPYAWLNQSAVDEYQYRREISRLELFNTIEMPAVLVDEY
jgi:hypothetical protein